jgi:hypothetical protein
MPSPIDLHIAECLLHCSPSTPRHDRLGEFRRMLVFASLLLCVICTSCGSVGSGPALASPPPLPVTVTVMPNSAQPFQGGNVQFNAVVKNASSPAVQWQVNQVTGGNALVGMIDPTGLYTAPTLVPNPPTVTVTAVSQSDATKTGSSSVTVQALSSVTGQLVVSPALSSLTTSQSLHFHVLTPGISNTDLTWAVDGGTITPGGIYTPPSTPGAYTIEASLPNAKGFATVEVTNFSGMLTWRNDNSRSGVNSQELVLSPGPGPGTVNSSTFGKLFSCPIDGYAYAQPLYVPSLAIPADGMRIHNVIFVATEKDSVFAFDADANPCVQLWQASLIPPGDQPILSPTVPLDISPSVGISGTPVIDIGKSVLYAVAAAQDVATGSMYSHWLYAIDLATGQKQIQPGGVEIATLPGQTPSFSSSVENQRPALILDNGIVYVAFGSYEAPGDYRGWLFAYDSTSLQATGVFDVAPKATSGGGIWQSGGGPSADSNHNIFVATGDGPPNFASNYIDSILRIGTNGGLSVADYFTPCDQGLDWGVSPNAVLQSESSAPVLLPDSAGSAALPHVLIGSSKEGFVYVVNRDSMGGFPSSCSDSAPRVQAIQTGGAILSTPLFWNNSVYVAAGNQNLMAFPMSGGILGSSPSVSQSPEILGPQGATPIISSNGTSNAILWLIDSSGALTTTNTAAILRAYDPNNLSNEIYNSAMAPASRDSAGPAVKFTVPTVANGKLYVGTQTELDVYGLLN